MSDNGDSEIWLWAPTGAPVHTLCGETPDRPAPPTDAEWLCGTCELCWNEACKLVGLR